MTGFTSLPLELKEQIVGYYLLGDHGAGSFALVVLGVKTKDEDLKVPNRLAALRLAKASDELCAITLNQLRAWKKRFDKRRVEREKAYGPYHFPPLYGAKLFEQLAPKRVDGIVADVRKAGKLSEASP